jgi:hypothetical protein
MKQRGKGIASALFAMAVSFGVAKANTFDVSGTYSVLSSGTFFGTLIIDVNTGSVTAADITVSGVGNFTNILGSAPCCRPFNFFWDIVVHDALGDELLLEFNTPPSVPPDRATLVGFTGGMVIFGEASTVCGPICLKEVATGFVGTITPSAVPGPVVGGGLPGVLGALGGVLGWRRRAQKAAWAKCTERSGGGPVHINTSYIAHAGWDDQKQATVVTFKIGRNDTITVKEAPLYILGGR